MGNVSDETKERIRSEVNFADVLGKYTRTPKPGHNKAMWFCPFHDDVRKPAMSVFIDEQFWHCFVCDIGGDIFDFVMQKENLNYKEAARLLCEQYGIEYGEDGGVSDDSGSRSLYQMMDAARKFFQESLADADEALDYLQARGFTQETIDYWGIGWAPGRGRLHQHLLSLGFRDEEMVVAGLIRDDGSGKDYFYDRLMFPIANTIGKTIAFGGRVLGDGAPKYLNSIEHPIFKKRNTLFGVHAARKAIGTLDAVVVTEGYVDAIMMHQAGIAHTVATLGTAVTNENLANLARMTKNVCLGLDNDEAGRKAARRVAEGLDGTLGLSVFVVSLPREPLRDDEGEPLFNAAGEQTFVKDPDDYFNRANHTAEDYLALMKDAPGLFTFVVSGIVADYDRTKASEREKAYNEAVRFLKDHRSAISTFQGLDACELLARELDLGMSGYELYSKTIGGGAHGQALPTENRRAAEGGLEQNVLRLLLDYPQKHRLFERAIEPEFFQDPVNYAIYQRILATINARDDLSGLQFDDGETQKAWARFLLTHPETGFDDQQAETAIAKTLNAMRKDSLRSLISSLESESEPDYDRIFSLKMELSKIR